MQRTKEEEAKQGAAVTEKEGGRERGRGEEDASLTVGGKLRGGREEEEAEERSRSPFPWGREGKMSICFEFHSSLDYSGLIEPENSYVPRSDSHNGE